VHRSRLNRQRVAAQRRTTDVPDDIDCVDILWSSGDDRVKKSSQPLLHQRGPRLGAASFEHHHGDRQAVHAVIHGLHYQASVLAADAT
jgi:hypothetical protein